MKQNHIEFAREKFAEVSKFLEGKQFLMGNKVSIADFAMFDAVCWHMELMPMVFVDLIDILKFHSRMNEIQVLEPLLNSGENYNSSIFTLNKTF